MIPLWGVVNPPGCGAPGFDPQPGLVRTGLVLWTLWTVKDSVQEIPRVKNQSPSLVLPVTASC